jgi:tetratricopeptide (TPR) repeat protein
MNSVLAPQEERAMTATHANTTRAAKARASAGSNDGAARGASEKATSSISSGALLQSIPQGLPGWLATLETPRKFAINALVIAASVLSFTVGVTATLKQVHVVETIGVPKDLEGDGYTSAIVAQRLIDAVAEINRTAALSRRIGVYVLSDTEPAQPQSTDSEGPSDAYTMDAPFSLTCDDPAKKYDVQVGGVSLTTVILYVRELFGLADTRISGEITVENAPAPGAGKEPKPPAKKFVMRLRVTGKGHVENEVEATDKLDTLFEKTALKLVERFEPLNAAYYSYYKRDFDNALRIVRVYLADPAEKDDTEWASNLLGLLEHARTRRDEARAEVGFDRAIAEFRKLRKSEPQFAPGLYNLAYVLIDKGKKRNAAQDKDAAEALFNEAYAVARDGIAVHEARDKTARGRAVGYATAGRALRQLARWDEKKYDEALHYYDLSIAADRLFISAYVSKGVIHDLRRAPETAGAVYQLATELNPTPQTFTRVGAVLRQKGRHADSVPMFQRAAEIEPSAKALTYWGMAVRDSGHPEQANPIFVKAINADPSVANGHNQLGLSYLGQKNWAGAAEQFKKAIELAPEWSNYHYNLGLALRDGGKLDEAIASFEKAIAIYPSHAWSYAQLGSALAQRERRDSGTVSEAAAKTVEQKLKRALALKPNDRNVLEALHEAYESMEWREQAMDIYRRSLAADDRTQGGLSADIQRPDRPAGEF